MTIERDVEKILEDKLIKEGWNITIGDINRNVYFRKPREKESVKKLGRLEPDFCLYINEESVNPDIIIETKKPGINLSKAKEQAMNYAQILGSKIIILFDGINIKSFWVSNSKTLIYDGQEVNDIHSPNYYKEFILSDNNEIIVNKTTIKSKEDLISVFAYANKMLRNAGITKGMERFFEFSNLLFLKLISEENNIISQDIPSHIKWDNYKNKKGAELLAYINDTVINYLENKFTGNGTYKILSKLIIQDTKALEKIITKLSSINIANIKTDIKGDAFEYFIQQYNNTNNDLGEYFTPRHIVNFMVKLADPKYQEKIYDPFCGTGGMLIASFNYLRDELSNKNMLSDSVINDLRNKTIYGNEISSNSRISKMNMILTGDGHSNIKQIDTLKHPVSQQYDVVISNIPFNLEGSAPDIYSLKSTNGNTQTIEHIIGSLKKKTNSRAYIIVPESVLNNSECMPLRKLLVEKNHLEQIISLPAGVFLPYTESKSSILVLRSEGVATSSTIKYTLIQSDGFTLTQRRRKILDKISDLEEYIADNNYNSIQIDKNLVLENENISLIWFKYINVIPQGYQALGNIIKRTSIINSEYYPTATITNSEFFGIVTGQDYWGDSFISVTSADNSDYHVLEKNHLGYNPSRANVGSIGINVSNDSFSVSKMYITFEVTSTDYHPIFVYLYLKSSEGMKYIKERCFGSVRQSLRYDDLCNIPIPIIPKEEQNKIVQSVTRLFKKYLNSKTSIDNIDISL